MILKLHELKIKSNVEKLRYIRGIVYKITNIKNNKSYIAITTRSLVDVLINKKVIGNKELNDDINLHSTFNFTVEILEHGKTSSELNELKKKYIEEFKSNTKELGYNKRVINERLDRELKITKDIAQRKLDELGRQFNIDIWEGTAKPVEVSCKFCGVPDSYSTGNSLFVEDSSYFKFRECKFCGNLYTKVTEHINLDLVGFLIHSKTDGNFNYYVTRWDRNDRIATISCKDCNYEQNIDKGILVNRLAEIECINCKAIKYEEEKVVRDRLHEKKKTYRNLHKETLDKKKYISNIKNKMQELSKKINDADLIIERNKETIDYINNEFEESLQKAKEKVREFIGNEELIGRTNFNEELMNTIDPNRVFINSNKVVDEFIMDNICEYETEKIKSKIFYKFISEKENTSEDKENKLEKILSENYKWIEIYQNNLLRYNESYNRYIEKLKELETKEEVTESKKYQFTGEETNIEYYEIVNCDDYSRKQKKVVTLKQILRIDNGLIGGWIESELNLSHEGNCFIYDNAIVFGDARVSGNAIVANEAAVYGSAEIKDNVFVGGNSEVYGNAVINGYAKITEHASIYDNALVMDEANISGYAKIYGDSVICERAKVSESAKVFENGIVCEDYNLGGRNIVKGYLLVSDEMVV